MSIFIIIAGISAYLSLPREKFPTAELDRIIVSGGYAKTSNEILDQMVVRDIENEIRSIEGIHEIRTTISNGSFAISSEINENYDNRVVSDKLRDAISKASNNLPSDMVLPTVRIAQHSPKVIQVALRIDEVNSQTLQTIDEIRDRMNSINGIESISVSGDNKLELKIFVDKKLLELYGIDIKDFGTSMRNLSNIFPVGEIGDSKYSFF